MCKANNTPSANLLTHSGLFRAQVNLTYHSSRQSNSLKQHKQAEGAESHPPSIHPSRPRKRLHFDPLPPRVTIMAGPPIPPQSWRGVSHPYPGVHAPILPVVPSSPFCLLTAPPTVPDSRIRQLSPGPWLRRRGCPYKNKFTGIHIPAFFHVRLCFVVGGRLSWLVVFVLTSSPEITTRAEFPHAIMDIGPLGKVNRDI